MTIKRNLIRPAAVLLLGLPSLGLAADSARGEQQFVENCSRCHTATQVPVDGIPLKEQSREPQRQPTASAGPDLSWIVAKKGLDSVERWVPNPVKVKEDAFCDTRNLHRDSYGDLLTFLASRPFPAVLPLEKRRDLELQKLVPVQVGGKTPVLRSSDNTDKKPKKTKEGGR